jgi:hypothetical protein
MILVMEKGVLKLFTTESILANFGDRQQNSIADHPKWVWTTYLLQHSVAQLW